MRNIALVVIISSSFILTAYTNSVPPSIDLVETLDRKCFEYTYGTKDTPQDIEKAIPLCEKAAQAGAMGAQNVIGHIYLETDRTEEAIHWLNESAKQGHTGAIDKLKSMGIELK